MSGAIAQNVTLLERRYGLAATAGGGLVTVAFTLAAALGASEGIATAVGVAAASVPGLVHGLVAAGGLRGAVQLLWRGR